MPSSHTYRDVTFEPRHAPFTREVGKSSLATKQTLLFIAKEAFYMRRLGPLGVKWGADCTVKEAIQLLHSNWNLKEGLTWEEWALSS
nr:hypothetical protein Iba_chr10bCG11850 [Ipomoea batatas]